MHKRVSTMKRYETLLGLFLLGSTLLLDILGYILRYRVGIWFSFYLLQVYSWLPFVWTHQHHFKPFDVGMAFVLFGFCLQIKIVATQVIQAQKERVVLNLRRPSKQEEEKVEKAYAAMEKKAYVHVVARWKHPPRFRVFQSEGQRVRFIGQVLVIDAGLFQLAGSPYLIALLARAMWDYNSGWLRIQSVIPLFPDASWAMIGFFGRWATWVGWQLYSRYHTYNADTYAALLGQKQSLLTTLEEVLLPLDQPREDFFYAEPYVELRIDRLHKLP